MLTYFLQVNLCWLLFYGLYYAILSKETFFKLNRFYLMLTLVGGLLLPLTANWLRQETPLNILPLDEIMLPVFEVSVKGNGLQMIDSYSFFDRQQGLTWWTLIGLIYFTGVFIESVRFLKGLYTIKTIYKKGKKQVLNTYTLVITEGVDILPFSFLNYIFIHESTLHSNDATSIMQHEQTHVQQKHSIDVLFLEVLQIIFWLSPCVYLYRHSLRNIHEYLADAAVLRSISKRTYGSLLIQQLQSGNTISVVNPFFSQLKKRIIMMSRNPSKRTSLIKYVLTAPILLVLILLLGSPNNPIMAETTEWSNQIKQTTQQNSPALKGTKVINAQNTVKPLTIKPIAVFGGKKGGLISVLKFKQLDELSIIDEKTGQEISCDKISYVLVAIPKVNDPRQVNVTSKTNTDVKTLINSAEIGSTYNFMNIKALIKGEKEPRDLGSMTFFITDDALYDISPNMPSLEPIRSTMPANTPSNMIIIQKDTTKDDDILNIVEETPEYTGGQKALFTWLGQNIRYPAKARENGIEGTVYVGYVVEKDGAITNVEIRRGVIGIIKETITITAADVNGVKGVKIVERKDNSLNDEALRVISSMPRWKPGKHNGKAVRVRYTLPIKFKLE